MSDLTSQASVGERDQRQPAPETGGKGASCTPVAGELLRLQRVIGNAAVARVLAPSRRAAVIHAQRSPVSAPLTIPTGGTDVGKVGIVNREGSPNLRLRATPDTTSDGNVIRSLPFNTHLQVIKRFGSWFFVSTPDGDLGYVAASYLFTNLPEPNARLHRVESGVSGTAIAIAEKYYKQHADDWGQDLRFYVNVLAWANKVPVPNTTAGWKGVHFDVGDLRWIPSYEFAKSLKGLVNSGSISYNVADSLGLASVIERAAELWDDFSTAISLSRSYLGPAIRRHVEEAFWSALEALALTLVGAVAILAISTAVGAAIGALAGGVGAAPGAAAGFEVGMVLLNWLGLGMLIIWLGEALLTVGKAFSRFLGMVWRARGNRKSLDRAAHQFAEATGILFGKLLEAFVMYAASRGLTAGLRGLQNSKLGKAVGNTKGRDWLTERVRRVKAGEAPLPGPKDVLAKIYRGVELYDAKKSPIGEFDAVDLRGKRFVENKSAAGLDRLNPRTGKPAQTEAQWAQKQITTKTNKRIDALAKAAGSRPTAGGSTTVPTLAQLQPIKHIHFQIDGSTPSLRAAVHAELAVLRTAHPGWKFTAEFGVDISVPPVPGLDSERQTEPAR